MHDSHSWLFDSTELIYLVAWVAVRIRPADEVAAAYMSAQLTAERHPHNISMPEKPFLRTQSVFGLFSCLWIPPVFSLNTWYYYKLHPKMAFYLPASSYRPWSPSFKIQFFWLHVIICGMMVVMMVIMICGRLWCVIVSTYVVLHLPMPVYAQRTIQKRSISGSKFDRLTQLWEMPLTRKCSTVRQQTGRGNRWTE